MHLAVLNQVGVSRGTWYTIPCGNFELFSGKSLVLLVLLSSL